MNEVVLSEHAELRVKERAKITGEQLVELLQAEAFAEVATTITQPVFKYLVVWDYHQHVPLLVILEDVDGIWSVKTVYETMTHHYRKHGVVVMYGHLHKAQKLYKVFRANLIAEERLKSYSVVRIDIVVQSKGSIKRYEKVGSMSRETYFSQYNSPRPWLMELLKNNSVPDLTLPSDSKITLELWSGKIDGGRQILVSEEL